MLNIIRNNPYRLLGIYSNSPTKERVANYNRLKAFLKVGKDISFALDLPTSLPSINRTADTVANADAELTLPNDQFRYAQFWFIKATPFDDIAMNHLTAGNIDSAKSIWEKKENASSLQNRIVCALIISDYKQALALAEKLYHSYSADFVNLVLGENHTLVIDKAEYIFLDELCSSVSVKDIMPCLPNDEWRQYVSSQAVKPLIAALQSAIDSAKAPKGTHGAIRYNAGMKLKNETQATLAQLKELLPVSDLQYQMIADKLGLEILQCSIDYYNDIKSDNAVHKAMELLLYAQSVVVGSMARSRCKENMNVLRRIIDELPPAEVSEEDKEIKKELGIFRQSHKGMYEAKILLEKTKPHLDVIKKELGAENAYYLKLSTQVINNALNCLIEKVNEAQSTIHTIIFDDADAARSKIENLKKVLTAAWPIIVLMDKFDMEPDFKKNRYKENRATLKNICGQLKVSTPDSTRTSTPDSTNGTWSCIAVLLILLGSFVGGVIIDGFLLGVIIVVFEIWIISKI